MTQHPTDQATASTQNRTHARTLARGAVVETACGRVQGVERHGVRAFMGIPFAAPPVGAARFLPPRPVVPWVGVREAVSAGPPAPQNPGLVARLLGLSADQASEDCLTLNLWTRGPEGAGRPVMVWIHGGSFTSGSGGSPIYDGAALARRGDVVVVTLNYRLGALGFLAHPDLAEEDGTLGNHGLLDQIAALRWVREHAAAFGGDPDNVTLFGESAGAMAVATLLGAPAAHGLFRRAILQSGGADNVSTRAQADRVAAHFLSELDLPADAVRRLREVPVAALLAAQERTVAALWREVSGLTFQPVVDGDLIPGPPIDAVADGAAAGVPLLLGTNLDEYKLWAPTDPKAASLDPDALRRRLLRIIPGEDSRGTPWADRAIQTYREARQGHAPVDASALWFAIQTDRLLRTPLLHLAERHASHQSDTWAYLFTWPSPAMEGALGACHALEIPFVFGTLGTPGVSAFTGSGPEAERLSHAMMDAWLAFARNGSPSQGSLSSQSSPSSQSNWPPYDAERRATQVFGSECPLLEAPAERERLLWDEIRAARRSGA